MLFPKYLGFLLIVNDVLKQILRTGNLTISSLPRDTATKASLGGYADYNTILLLWSGSVIFVGVKKFSSLLHKIMVFISDFLQKR